MTGNSIIYGNLTLSAGQLTFNGHNLTFGNSNSDLISVSGLLEIDSGASLLMFNGSSITTNSGGVLRVIGVPGNLALVTVQSSSGSYNFTITSGATIHARNAKFEYMGNSGINVQTNASIDAVNNFSDVQFDNGQAGGSMLAIGDIIGSNQRLDISNASFLSNPGGGAFNVSHTIGSDTLNFVEAQGPFAGEAFDDDSPGDDLILWTDLAISRVWDGSENSVWTNPNNWTDNIVPADSEDANIPAMGVSNEPNITETVRCRNLNISSGRTLTVSNGATLDLGGYIDNNGTLTLAGSSILTIAGNFDNVHGTLNDNASTVIFDSSLTQTIQTGGVGNVKRFYNLEVNKAGGSLELNSDLEVNNNFNISAGTFNANGYSMTIANNWSNSGSFISGGNQVTFDAQAAGPFVITSDVSPFHNILFNTGNDAYTYVLGSDLSATGDVTILHGVLNANGSNLDIDGNFANSSTFQAAPTTSIGGDWTNTGTFTAGSGVVIFDGTGDQTIATGGTGADRGFYHFDIDKAGGSATLTADLEVNGNFSINNGTLNSAAMDLFISASWTNSGTWVQSGGTVTFDAPSGGPYSITSSGSGAFNHFTIDASGLTYRLESDLNVDGDFVLSAGTLQNQGYTINLAGDWINNGIFTPSGGAVIFDGSGNQDVNSGGTGPGKIFPDFICAKTGGDLKINDAIKLNGNVTVSNGIFDMNGCNVNLTGNFINNGTIDNPATLTFDATSGGPYNIYGGISTLNIMTINAPGVTYQLSGETRMNGNLNINTGQLDLNGQMLFFGDGADVISVNGILEVDAGSILAMADGSSLIVNSGGIVRLVGISGNRAIVTEQSASGSYIFTVGSGGFIHARYALLEYMGSNGINIQNGATIDAVNNFSNVT
ncbi:MAG: hypothetical protein KAJ16_05205, partial [Calditrichia bacterium]|nr:hypothetical protein [Calditrichia bacterium]